MLQHSGIMRTAILAARLPARAAHAVAGPVNETNTAWAGPMDDWSAAPGEPGAAWLSRADQTVRPLGVGKASVEGDKSRLRYSRAPGFGARQSDRVWCTAVPIRRPRLSRDQPLPGGAAPPA
ncbi:MAG: hypothetical protein LC637_03975 [Xanthomonadaceae bacterium]|nr:hypothetical protein [Xanthomonadaceae bacterium]